ncbi:hypothetical protein C8Q73DRAFT_663929 [Cubamyces lactineus]|nr:hypothetical protein C8Q73DRAFT_663929 [Cubamyces lactineus]
MILLNPPYYHDDPLEDSPPLPPHRPLYPPHGHHNYIQPQPPIGFSYPGQLPPFQPYPAPYPLQAPLFSHQQSQFMPHQQHPSYSRPVSQSVLNDPAFSPDPRSNLNFFSMNDREEIYPASVSDSLSDYASTAPDDESEIDHSKLPPRLRLLHSPDVQPQALPPQHARSQSAPYAPPMGRPGQYTSQSSTARVIPVPPPISYSSTSSSHMRRSSREEPRQKTNNSSPVYASAWVAAREVWQPPPPYADSESGSSSSSSPQTPASSSSHLPRDAQRSTSSLSPASAYVGEKAAPPSQQSPPSAGPSQSRPNTQSAPEDSAPPSNRTSTVQSTAARPSIAPRNASAPELHQPPPPTDVPPRPSTVPIAAPTNSTVSAPAPQRKRSKNPSISAPPRDLDRIDELDESDPLGARWHHDGPYEAIMKAAPVLYPDQSILAHKRSESSKRKPVQYDDVSLGLSPGQIFPSNSQYQPPSQNQGAQQPPVPENFPPGSMPSSPLMQVPVQRRVPPSGQLPSSPELYNNVHMGAANTQQRNAPAQDPQGSRLHHHHPPPPPLQSQRSRPEEPAQPSPPLPNPYSPVESSFPQNQRDSPPHTRAPSVVPSSSQPPRPDINLPPQQPSSKSSSSSSSSLLPRHVPKRLVMPAPLQQPSQDQPPHGQDGRSAAHVEVLAQRHVNHHTPSSRPTMPPSHHPSAQQQQQQQQQVRAQDIPMSHGPKVLRKRHTTSGAPPPPSSSGPAPLEIPTSNATAALFAARVRFADPGKEETKEERKRREKGEARRAKEREKAEKEQAKAKAKAKEREREDAGGRGGGGGGLLGAVFVRDHVKEAELAREREMAKASASAKSSGRKLSKRR